MSTLGHISDFDAPGDDDLNAMYDKVWASFSNTASLPAKNETVNVVGGVNGDGPVTTSDLGNRTSLPHFPPAQNAVYNNQVKSIQTPVRTQSSGSVTRTFRPLPVPPTPTAPGTRILPTSPSLGTPYPSRSQLNLLHNEQLKQDTGTQPESAVNGRFPGNPHDINNPSSHSLVASPLSEFSTQHSFTSNTLAPKTQTSYPQYHTTVPESFYDTRKPGTVQTAVESPESEINEGFFSLLRRPSISSESHSSLGNQGAYVESSSSHSNYQIVKPAPIHPAMNRIDSMDSYTLSVEPDNWSNQDSGGLVRRFTHDLQDIANFGQQSLSDDQAWDQIEEEPSDEIWDPELDDPNRFINFSLLSNLAVLLRDQVPRGTHVKGSIPYPRSFTGKDIVSTIQAQIQRELIREHCGSVTDRRAALLVARSLQNQLFFYEVEWGSRSLQDGVEDVYMFLDDQEGGSDSVVEREELPTGVVTVLTKCYSLNCRDYDACYVYSCPRRKGLQQLPETSETPAGADREDWIVPSELFQSLPESVINRQIIIHKLISKEEQYVSDLDIVESAFIKPLRKANPPVIPSFRLEEFIEEIFGNILELRECNRRLLEVMYVRQREQAPIIQSIGDIILGAATEFRLTYPAYVGHHPIAEKRLREEMEQNPEFRLFTEKCSRKRFARSGDTVRLDLRHLLNRPSEHLQKYPVLLEAILNESNRGNPDSDYVLEAIEAIKNLQNMAQLRIFQSAMGKGMSSKWEWHDLISPDVRMMLSKEECKRQAIIFELIKGEMDYVKDLENVETMYIQPLRETNPPIVPYDKLEQFIHDVFHNFSELHAYHRRLVDTFHEIQREEHPRIRSITAAVLDAALNFREAYMEYIPNYPIAAHRIDDEVATNPAFKDFVEKTIRHPDAHRLDMKNFINRPIPRLLRYELLLKAILDETPANHEDRETIPQVIDIIKALGRDTEPGVASSKQKVEVWRYNSSLVFKTGEIIDIDLLNENRSLIHSGKLLRQPDSGLEWNGWSELFVLLFDNYLVMTKPRERDGVTKYHVNRRPIPVDLLTLNNFSDPPVQRGTGLLRTLRSNDRHTETSSTTSSNRTTDSVDSRGVYPCVIHHTGRLGGLQTVYAESAQSRLQWKQKLEEAIGLRQVVQESNKVFEIETLSVHTFFMPPTTIGPASPPIWHDGSEFTGKVTCSIPFNTPDGRELVAIGCEEGVWIGFRNESRSMKHVLHLRIVKQCAMLEDFGIFLVLADKSLFAYHIEALVPTNLQTVQASQTPQKLSGSKDVQFFSVGSLHGRTLVVYMKRKGVESLFHIMEPVVDKINDRPRTPGGLLSLPPFRSNRSEWFRPYRNFRFPSEAYDLVFLKAKVAILCAKGFEIMDLTDFQSIAIPQREHPRLAQHTKRLDSCRPLGIFKSTEDEFLLCYDEFGIFVNKRGEPSRTISTIEWEGTIERAAFHFPYILLFDSRFIEVRHVKTGRLAQIIPGNDVRCVWDGRTSNSSVTDNSFSNDPESMAQEPQVHSVTHINEPVMVNGRPSRGVLQHVYELVPTIPLYLPGSLSSPSAGAYYTEGFSSPHSPQLRSTTHYRS